MEHEHERAVLTRNGRAAAVIISPEDLAQLEETIGTLSVLTASVAEDERVTAR